MMGIMYFMPRKARMPEKRQAGQLVSRIAQMVMTASVACQSALCTGGRSMVYWRAALSCGQTHVRIVSI